MKVAVDTNVLVRAAVRDDLKQAHRADALLKEAELIAISTPCLCEFVWVLRRTYGMTASDASVAIRALISAEHVVIDRPVVEAGLEMLEAGGDFADGAMAFEGQWLGGETFASFDKAAIRLLTERGVAATLL